MIAYENEPVDAPVRHFVFRDVRWADYLGLRELLDSPGVRMTYCEGVLEVVSPSRMHELWKSTIGRLVEVYALERDIPLQGYGSTTFLSEARARGVEPDECYRVGTLMKDGEIPDIVVEVIYASPLLDKLAVYLGLGIPEVWLFEKGTFRVYHLVEGLYEGIQRSRFLPDLDFTFLAGLVRAEDQHAAVRTFRDTLRRTAR